MDIFEEDSLSFTDDAWESLYNVIENPRFLEQDASIIYEALKKHVRFIPFGTYLRRYIYLKAGLTEPFKEVPLDTYQQIIKYSFTDNHTPPSFVPTTAKLSALSKNWLTQHSVSRKVVFLLGFGLNMSIDDVNTFLTKALREPEINPKDPFEVICRYCLVNKFNYLKFEQLWNEFITLPAGPYEVGKAYGDQTFNLRNTVYSIHTDAELMAYLAKFKTAGGLSAINSTSTRYFAELYAEAQRLVAEKYSAAADKQYLPEDITPSDLENIISAAIPTDRHGNLTPSKASKLNKQFDGKRFSRQHISEILSGDAEVTRFDLVTLSFFVFSQKLEEFPDPKVRYQEYFDSTNHILEVCYMGGVYIQNPYECFTLMCMLTDSPLETYSDVWELSYSENE